MPTTQQQESFGDAFLSAVCAVCGYAIAKQNPDMDSVDWTIADRSLPRRPRLDVQIKTRLEAAPSGGNITFPLKLKNYNDLRSNEILVPRILLYVSLPSNIDDWLALSESELSLRRCAYWLSLAGQPETQNETNVTVYIPRQNLFSVPTLTDMMRRIDQGQPL